MRQLIFGLLYGSALSGLGLLAWRRSQGKTSFPSMPGHWLLVLGGIGFLLDSLTAWIAMMIMPDRDMSPYWVHQVFGWSAAALISIPFCFAKSAPPHWRALAVVATLMLTANAVTHALGAAAQLAPYILQRQLFAGSWPFFYGPLARVVGEALCMSLLPILVWSDVRAGLQRDWLHWSGAVVITGLAVADIAQNVEILLRF